MNHADDRSLRARPASDRDRDPLPARGAWAFVPTDLPLDAFGSWHEDELLSRVSDEPTRAECVVRLTGGPGGRVTVLVRGVIVHGETTPLVLHRWHRAVRV